MSEKRAHEIGCPFCGREQRVELWDVLHAEDEPEGREALLNGRINRVTCAGCGREFRIEKPLVYHDRGEGIFVHYDPLVGGRTLAEAEEAFRGAMEELGRLLPPAPRAYGVTVLTNEGPGQLAAAD